MYSIVVKREHDDDDEQLNTRNEEGSLSLNPADSMIDLMEWGWTTGSQTDGRLGRQVVGGWVSK